MNRTYTSWAYTIIFLYIIYQEHVYGAQFSELQYVRNLVSVLFRALPRDLIAARWLINMHAYNLFMSSIFITYLTLIRVIKCTHVTCCWQEPQKHSLPRVLLLLLLLEALIKQYITNIEQKNKKRDVFDKGLANGRGVPTRQTPYILLYTIQ